MSCSCNPFNPVKVSFNIRNFSSDTITAINGITFTGSYTASSLATMNPQFWIEPDTDGNNRLCTTKVAGWSLQISLLSGETPYTLNSNDFVEVDFFGGHPHHRPGRPVSA